MSNKMAKMPIKKMIWQMGLPMIVSMVLQALYNIVDTAFVINMGEEGENANLALTYAFPIQILIIAVGVGTGIGINALLSRSLGEGDKKKASKVAGNGIFLALVIYLVFLLFGLFLANAFIKSQANGNTEAIKMGTSYLAIVCCLSFGSVGYTVYERFLQATGKTMYSTISQIAGALTNIVLDYVFIYPLGLGVEGAAYATVIGQCVSLGMAMYLHYFKNKEIEGSLKYIKPSLGIIGNIYKIGFSAMLMQGLLSVMMFGCNMILGASNYDSGLLQGSFGIYYKVQQFALFACFGLSNALITIISFNYGMKERKRVIDGTKYGIIASIIVALVITVLFEALASPIAKLFGLASGDSSSNIVQACTLAIRIASIGYIFMAITVGIQGILQGLRYSIRPLILSLLRLVIFVFPLAFLFTQNSNAKSLFWITFPISEFLTSIIAAIMIYKCYKTVILKINGNNLVTNNLIISISRMHGTLGKEIGRALALELNIKFYDKELSVLAAKKAGLDSEYIANLTEKSKEYYNTYLSLDVNQEAMIAQAEVIKKVAELESCVLVGRASNYILRDYPNMISVFIKAPLETRVNNVISVYKDSKEEALANVLKSDKARATYYEKISGLKWGLEENYDFVIDSSIGVKETVLKIKDFITKNN